MAEEKLGIKETNDVVLALFKVGVVLAKKAHDGLQVSDLAVLLADEDVKKSLLEAAVGIEKVPAEVKDMDASEVVQMAVVVLEQLPSLLGALKKDAVAS